MKTWHLLALFAILLSGCTSLGTATEPAEGNRILASDICPSVSDVFFIPDWQLLAVAAMAGSVAILVILYLVDVFFGNEQGIAAMKLELFELFTTAFIVIVVIAILDAACIVPIGAILAPDEVADLNLFEAAAQILDDFSKSIVIVSTILHGVYIHLDFITTTTLTQRPMGMGTEFQPTAGIGAVMKPAFINSLQMLAVSFIIVRAQLAILDFVTFAMLKFYLPIGIILRSFTPTRRIGGTLIGLTLGLVLVYPYLIILNGLTIYDMDPFYIDEYLGSIGGMLEAAWEPFNDFQGGALSLAGGLDILTYIKLFISSLFGSLLGIYLSLTLRTAAVAFMIGLFFPALNMLILVTVVRYLTKAFGEEIDVSNLSRMI